jgi:putative transposase
MRVEDVTDTLNPALATSGCASAHVRHKPRLLSDNGPSYIAVDLAKWFGRRNIKHIRGAPCHPQTQETIEHWHQTLKNRSCSKTITYQVTSSADVYHDRGHAILHERERIKRQTIQTRYLRHSQLATQPKSCLKFQPNR